VTGILAIDTASERFALAWQDATGLLRSMQSDDARDHSRQLIPAIEQLVEGSLASIEAIIVITGPGSYAGLRVGIATAEGLALARSVPVFGVSTMEAAAGNEPAQGDWTIIHPVGRGDFAVQPWRDGAPVGDIRIAHGNELSGPELKGESAGALGGIDVGPAARATSAIALRREAIAQGDTPAGVEAFYIREPHITRPRRAAMGASRPETT
jgi:tRNA threonylcarbamoyl adenosine modification protein YeaZ